MRTATQALSASLLIAACRVPGPCAGCQARGEAGRANDSAGEPADRAPAPINRAP